MQIGVHVFGAERCFVSLFEHCLLCGDVFLKMYSCYLIKPWQVTNSKTSFHILSLCIFSQFSMKLNETLEITEPPQTRRYLITLRCSCFRDKTTNCPGVFMIKTCLVTDSSSQNQKQNRFYFCIHTWISSPRYLQVK